MPKQLILFCGARLRYTASVSSFTQNLCLQEFECVYLGLTGFGIGKTGYIETKIC